MAMSQEVSTEIRKRRPSDIPTASVQQMQTNIYLKKIHPTISIKNIRQLASIQ
jgi:hypothetical protein